MQGIRPKNNSTKETIVKISQGTCKEIEVSRKTVQVDNAPDFVNDHEVTNKEGPFEQAAQVLGIDLKRIRPIHPWQNGKVKRSHREYEKILYELKVFTARKI